MSTFHILGLMSGTSMDGVDLAIVETDGEGVIRLGPSGFMPYEPEERALITQAIKDAVYVSQSHERAGCLKACEDMVTQRHILAVQNFLNTYQGPVDAIAFHGQTVLHRPNKTLTIQLGHGQALSNAIGKPVIYDFRQNDMRFGGQGAPLVPVFHQALVEATPDLDEPAVVINIGGVANITYIERHKPPLACDVGPGNALIDDYVLQHFGKPYDEGGQLAAKGHVNSLIVETFLENSFFKKAPPKSLDRNAFNNTIVSRLEPHDGVATLTALTAQAIAAITIHLPNLPKTWVIAGGGAFNLTLINMLKAALTTKMILASDLGWSLESLEAQAFAYLGARHLKGLPLTFPSTTGVSKPVTGGVLVKPVI